VAIRDAVSSLFAFQNTKVWHKLALVVATLVLPVTALNWLLLSSYKEQIDFAKKELDGARYLQPLRKLTQDVVQHRGLANAYLLGDAQSKKELQTKQGEINDDIKAVTEVDTEFGEALHSKDKWSSIRSSWSDLEKRVAGLKPGESFDQHNVLLKDILGLFSVVGNSSNLLLDPNSLTAHFTDTVANRIPPATDYLGQIRDLAVTGAVHKELTSAEQAQLLVLIGQSKPYRDAIDANTKALFRESPDLESQLKSATTDHLVASDDLINLVVRSVVNAGATGVAISSQDLNDAGNRAINSGFRLFDDSVPDVRALLQAKVDSARSKIFFAVFSSAAGILLTLLIGARVTRTITQQVDSITNLFSQIGVGNYEARAEITSSDELGTMAGSLNTMLDNTLVLVQSRGERDAIQGAIVRLLDDVSGVAEGDLTREAEVTDDVTGAIADAFNYMIYQLRKIISDVQDATLQVGTSAIAIHQNSEQLVHGSETQAQQIIATSTAIEEITLSIQQVSENAADSAAVAQQALANATQGNEAVQNTIQGMNRIRDQAQETAKRIKRLGESSQEIGQIVQLIDDIADRTSILALNASIQAAAAGEAGRGFAVVAEEVERLAERSTDATKKIATLIKTIQSETNEAVGSMEKSIHEVVEGSKLANQAGKALEEIGSVSNRLAGLIQSISQASRTQATGSEAIAKSMGNISQITQQTASGTRLAADSVNDLAALADTLRSSVSTFRLPGRTWQPDGLVPPPLPNGNGNGHSEPPTHDVVAKSARSGEFRRIPVHV
jgi:twitching motility protein PilJ